MVSVTATRDTTLRTLIITILGRIILDPDFEI